MFIEVSYPVYSVYDSLQISPVGQFTRNQSIYFSQAKKANKDLELRTVACVILVTLNRRGLAERVGECSALDCESLSGWDVNE